MLELTNVSYHYHKKAELFRHVQLSVAPGEVVGLFGQSGKGKSTLAKIAGGYLTPKQGDVMVDGVRYPFSGYDPVQLVGQHPELAFNPRWRLHKALAESGEDDPSLWAELGIKQAWLERFPSELSGGELQRMSLARALRPQTQYLLADEMTTMLDAMTQAQIWQIVLQKVNVHHLGVLAISHDYPLLQRISTRLINFTDL